MQYEHLQAVQQPVAAPGQPGGGGGRVRGGEQLQPAVPAGEQRAGEPRPGPAQLADQVTTSTIHNKEID